MIGALAYFGVLNPSRYLPERCNFGSEVTCADYLIDDAGSVLVKFVNNMGETVKVTDISVVTPDGRSIGCAVPTANGASLATEYTWKDGATMDVAFGTCAQMDAVGIVQGEKTKVLMNMTYYSAKSSIAYSHTIQGDLYAQVN
jgi:hypothetical protein